MPSLLVALLAVSVSATAAVRPDRHYVWLETEQFADLGGWLMDSQFIDQMGSTYLLAQGLHEPVADAVTRAELPARGTWCLWARTKNWATDVATPPGRFTVGVGAWRSQPLGTSREEGWRWQFGGAFHHDAGEIELRLHDLSGEYGRCDALLLTDDINFEPASDMDAYRALRHALTGVNGDLVDRGEWDVVVVGGGLAGTFAAIAAARHGSHTALIQDRPVLGGNASIEVKVGVAGASANRERYSRESGLIEEARREAERVGSWSAGMAVLARQEPNLDLFLMTRQQGVEMTDAQTIGAVVVRDVLTGQGYRLRGRIFIDCTGDATVGAAAGADSRWGREARSEFDESLAPEQADRLTLGSSLLFGSEQMPQPVTFVPPAWARHFGPDGLPHRGVGAGGGYWWIEWGGEHDTITDAEAIRDELLRILHGVWDHAKNQWAGREQAAKRRLKWVNYVAGKRESRRLIGDHILTQREVQRAELFRDRVAYGGWPIDLHPPAGIYDPEPPCIQVPVPLYSIPYRCLYSRNVDNLLMAGRDISVSHVALGTTRVMATCGTQGQAVGTAAALCVAHQATPREVGQQYLAELQMNLLRDDAYLLEMPLRSPDDLAQTAHATATSEVSSSPFDRDSIRPRDKHACDGHDRAAMLPSPGDRVQRAWALLQNETTQELTARMLLRTARSATDFGARPNLAEATATVAPGRHWVAFDFNTAVGDAPFVWFVVTATKGLSWYLTETGPSGAARAYSAPGKEGWTLSGQMYALCTEPATAMVAGCAADKAVDGWARPHGADFCGWVSDPQQKLPQALELRWDQPVRLGQVDLVFDTNLNPTGAMDLFEREVVKSYDIEVQRDGVWHRLEHVEGNYQRMRIHRFAPLTVEALRVVVLETGGDRSARIFEVRAWQ